MSRSLIMDADTGESPRDGIPHPVVGSSKVERHCPRCGMPLRRVRRTATDRLRSLVSPVRRYQCLGLGCHWEGTLRN